METNQSAGRTYRALFIGAGPGGTGPIVCALQQGRLAELLDSPIAVVDRGDTIGGGTIGKYVINSDTMGGTFLECLERDAAGVLRGALGAEPTRLIAERRAGAVPLRAVGAYMGLLGDGLRQAIERHPASRFLPRTAARRVRRLPDGTFETELASQAPGAPAAIRSEAVVFAMGAGQSRERALAAEIRPGLTLHPYDARLMLSDTALTEAGVAEIAERLRGAARPRVAVVGGSHSALSAAWTLLNRVEEAAGVSFGEGDITILHRDRLRLFYPSREAALAEGYTDFTDADFCPVTGRLFRLGGFRLDSRELLMRIWGMGAAPPERRVRLVRLAPDGGDAAAVRALLDESTLVIAALGYRPNTVPVLGSAGAAVELLGDGPGAPPLVDGACRVLDAAGEPVPGVYGIGLASGFMLGGALGGEPSFTGQTNGLWLYQNGVGEIVLNQLLSPVAQPAAR